MPADLLPGRERAARPFERAAVSGEGADRDQASKRARCRRGEQDQCRTAERDDGAGGLVVGGG
jgi:hypothetical protein